MAALSLSSARTPQAETIPPGLTIPLDKTSRHHHFDDTQESLIASRWDLFPSCPERNPLPFFSFLPLSRQHQSPDKPSPEQNETERDLRNTRAHNAHSHTSKPSRRARATLSPKTTPTGHCCSDGTPSLPPTTRLLDQTIPQPTTRVWPKLTSHQQSASVLAAV